MKNTLYNLCKWIFNITLPLFMLMGAALVFGQILGVFMNNPNLVLWLKNILKDQAIIVSCVTGFAGFFAYYLKPTKQ